MTERIFYMPQDDETTGLWAFRTSGPMGSAYGVSDSLQDAQRDARAAILDLMDDQPFDSSDTLEYFERVHPLGFVIRFKLNGDDAELAARKRTADLFGGTALYTNERSPIDISRWGQSSYGVPLVIACLPDDHIADVVDQLHPSESCGITLAFEDPSIDRQACWFSGIYRAGAETTSTGQPLETLGSAGLGVESTINEMMVESGYTPEILLRGEMGAELRPFGALLAV